MATSEQDALEDLAYGEAEGAADMYEDSLFGESEGEGESDGVEDYSEFGEDALDFGAEDGLGVEEAEESIGNMLGQMLSSEEEDEFLGKLLSGAKTLLQKAAPVVGSIARGAAPILSMIPHPAAQMAGQVASVLSNLKAEGASVEDALEAVAEVAARDPRALPIVAGLAARSVVRNRGAALPPVQRQQIAKTITRAAKTLVQHGGPQAIRALPKITRSVKRTAGARGTGVTLQPRIVARTAAKVAQNPSLLRRLSVPSPRARSVLQRTVGIRNGDLSYGYSGGGSRTFTIPGPATITINMG
jgi:hypothetical protein